MTTKICIVFLFAIFIEVLSAPSNSVIVSNGFTVIRNNERIICDKLTCPEEAERCVITSKTDDTNEHVITTWKCIGENDKVLSEEQSTDKNHYNKIPVNIHIESGPSADAFWNEALANLEQYLDDFWKNFDPFGTNNKE